MITDGIGRPCGEWMRTHRFLRFLGFPEFYRSLYAHAMIGGGWDGFEFSRRYEAAANWIEGYFDIAARRIQDAYDRPDLFIAPRAPDPVQQPLFGEVSV